MFLFYKGCRAALIITSAVIWLSFDVKKGMPRKYSGTIIEDLFLMNLIVSPNHNKHDISLKELDLKIREKWLPVGKDADEVLKMLKKQKFEIIVDRELENGDRYMILRKIVRTLYIARFRFQVRLLIQEQAIYTSRIKAVAK